MAQLSLLNLAHSSQLLGLVVGAYGETPGDVYAIAEAVAEELATEHCGFYSHKKQGVVAAFFLSLIYRSWGLTAHRGWARLMPDRQCLVEVPNAPRMDSHPGALGTPQYLPTPRSPPVPTSAFN